MNRSLTVAILAAAGAAAALPAVTTAQDPSPPAAGPTLSTPLPTGCYSNPGAPSRSGAGAPGVKLPDLGLTGGPAGQRYTVTARTSSGRGGESGSSTGRFDANGNATVTGFTVAKFVQPGPASTSELQVQVAPNANQSSEPGDVQPYVRKLGTVTYAGYGGAIAWQQQDDPNDPNPQPGSGSAYQSGKAYPVIVSGAPLANRKLYGFVVRSDKQVLKRFALGTTDACGYATAKAVTWPRTFKDARTGKVKKIANPSALSVHVMAGPTFVKSRALLRFTYRG